MEDDGGIPKSEAELQHAPYYMPYDKPSNDGKAPRRRLEAFLRGAYNITNITNITKISIT